MKRVIFLGAVAAGLVAACGNGDLFSDSGPSATSATATNGSSASSDGGGNGNGGMPATSSGNGGQGGAVAQGGGGQGGCNPGPNEDFDGDGYSIADGDCDDCEALANPGNIEIPGDAIDDDCDGNLDNTLMPCDGGIALTTDNPLAALEALELCKQSSGPGDWGVVSASWVMADGSPPPGSSTAEFHLGHGVMNGFGQNVPPRAGQQLLVLSNGSARLPGDPGYQDIDNGGKGYDSPMPPGFPKTSPSCGQTSSPGANDPVGLEAVIRLPGNATGFAFQFDFYSADFPAYVCSGFDDAFVALVSPAPANLPDEHVNFLPGGDIYSLNGAPFDVCSCGSPPCMAGGKSFACSQGETRLQGTGFEGRGATGWQRTTVAVPGGSEVTVRWTIWDGSDGVFVATSLVDAWEWLTDPSAATVTVPLP